MNAVTFYPNDVTDGLSLRELYNLLARRPGEWCRIKDFQTPGRADDRAKRLLIHFGGNVQTVARGDVLYARATAVAA